MAVTPSSAFLPMTHFCGPGKGAESHERETETETETERQREKERETESYGLPPMFFSHRSSEAESEVVNCYKCSKLLYRQLQTKDARGQTDTQRHGRKDRQTGGWISRQTHKQAGGQTDRETDER